MGSQCILQELRSILHQHLHVSKSIDLKRLFAFPLADLPLAIAEPDDTLRKTTKSLVIHKLEEDTEMFNVRRVDHTLVVVGVACVTQSKTHDLSYQ